MGPAKNSMTKTPRTSIGLKRETKERLDRNKHPGQSYDGFVCQLVDSWEKMKRGEHSEKQIG